MARDKEQEKMRLCLCSFPWATEPGRIHPLTLARTLREASNSLWVVAKLKPEDIGDARVKVFTLRPAVLSGKSRWAKSLSVPRWVIANIFIQAAMSRHLMRITGEVDTVVFGEGPHYLLPVIAAKLLGKKVVKYSPATVGSAYNNHNLSLRCLAALSLRLPEAAVFMLANRILVPPWKNRRDLKRYRQKVSIAPYYCVRSEFTERKEWSQRGDVVGYTGHLIEAEGAFQLARAIPLILQKMNVRFLIVGEGILLEKMKTFLARSACLDKVNFIGRVPAKELPNLFNETKFQIVPSFSDFSGGVIPEAMACGAVVIANKVGGITNIVSEGKSGFLMEDNSPESIAGKLIEAWQHPELERIRQNGIAFARENFAYEAVVKNWVCLLGELRSE